MRVIRCPNCDEPQPNCANFCAACGANLVPSPTSVTARISRPRSLRVPRFFILDSANYADATAIELSETFSAQTSMQSQLSSPAGALPTPAPGRSANWHRVVNEQERPPRAPSQPRIPAAVPPYAQLPPPPPAAYIPRARRQRRHSPFFWLSTLLAAAVVCGGLLGIIVTLGHTVGAQVTSHNTTLALQITPSTVALGAVITVRGTNFSPHTPIGLTRDAAIPAVDTGDRTITQANGQGNFTDTLLVTPDWQAGPHIIRAEDAHLHKSAAFAILVTGHSAPLRPAHLLLSSSIVDLGDEDQATNSMQMLTLANAGGGQISWQATTTEPWLLLSPRDGTFASGQAIHVMIAAERANLHPGSYAGQVIFISNAGQATLPVKMRTRRLQVSNRAVLQLTPPVLAFSGADNGSSPPAQVVTLSNPGARGLQWSAFIQGGSDWLALTSLSGSVAQGGSQAVVVSVNSSNQLPGTYGAFVTFTGLAQDSPQSVYISLTIAAQCSLQVSPGSLTFASLYLQRAPASQTVSVNASQSCTQPLKWSAIAITNSAGRWLTISPPSGTTSSFPVVSINVAGLKPGQYSALIIFSTAVGTQTVPVALTIASAQGATPIITTSSTQMSFNGIAGQAQAPAAQRLTISNTGNSAFSWRASASTSSGGAWLSLTSTSGSLYPQESARPQVQVAMLPGLTPNTYTGAITITAVDSAGHATLDSPQIIPITLKVLQPCTISMTPSALTFSGVTGQPNPAAQPVTIAANSTCKHRLNWALSIANGPWITTKPAVGSVGPTASTLTDIGVALAELRAGSYTAQVGIMAVDSITHASASAPHPLVITLAVQPPCTLQAPSVTNETFNSERGSNPLPARRSFTIGILGACTGKITIIPTVTQSWLAITPAAIASGRGEASFTISATASTLNSGNYSDTISLAAVSAGGITIMGSPQTIAVTLHVLAPPALALSTSTLTFDVATGTTSQAIEISNTGGEPLNWTALPGGDAPAFVSLSASSGTNLAGGTGTLLGVIVDASGVAGGSSFRGSVIVSATDLLTGNVVSGSPFKVSITINIAPPAMQLNTNTLSYTTNAGINPPAQSLLLTNSGGGLTWTAGAPSQAWLSLGVKGGSVEANATSSIPFNIDVIGTALGSGPYTATVVITPSLGPPQTVTVTLTVN